MNVYLVVEGCSGEKKVYGHWVPLVNPSLKVEAHLDQITENNLYIVSGFGYPYYVDVIKNGALDVASNEKFDRLCIAVDAENNSCQEKKQEITELVDGLGLNIDYHVIVQYFCIETWALGNRKIGPRHPKTDLVRYYRDIFNVLTEDPELLPGLPEQGWNRSQFAFKYLKSLINEKNRNMTYKKNDPGFLLNEKFFQEVKDRHENINHILSFGNFLSAFI